MPTNLNPLAPEYTPIQPGVTTNQNLPSPPFSTVLNQILPPQPTPQFSSHFYAYVSYTSVQQPTYYAPALPQNRTPPRLVGPRYGPREMVDGRSRSGQRGSLSRAGGRGRKEVFDRDGRMWEPNRNDRKVLGFQKEEKSSRQNEIIPLKWEEEKTSVMIKNIPYDCPRKELMRVLDAFCMMENEKDNEEVVAYDFLYLPVDFRTNMSRGFAFVNFTNAKAVKKFFDAWNLVAWDSIHWRRWTKTIEIVTAKIQGKEALVGHFSDSCFECESNEFLPVTFNPARDGSGHKVKTTVVGNRRAFQRWGARKV